MYYRRLLSLLVYSTFVVGISDGFFLFLNVVFVLVWLTCLISMIDVPPLSHSGVSLFVW